MLETEIVDLAHEPQVFGRLQRHASGRRSSGQAGTVRIAIGRTSGSVRWRTIGDHPQSSGPTVLEKVDLAVESLFRSIDSSAGAGLWRDEFRAGFDGDRLPKANEVSIDAEQLNAGHHRALMAFTATFACRAGGWLLRALGIGSPSLSIPATT